MRTRSWPVRHLSDWQPCQPQRVARREVGRGGPELRQMPGGGSGYYRCENLSQTCAYEKLNKTMPTSLHGRYQLPAKQLTGYRGSSWVRDS